METRFTMLRTASLAAFGLALGLTVATPHHALAALDNRAGQTSEATFGPGDGDASLGDLLSDKLASSMEVSRPKLASNSGATVSQVALTSVSDTSGTMAPATHGVFQVSALKPNLKSAADAISLAEGKITTDASLKDIVKLLVLTPGDQANQLINLADGADANTKKMDASLKAFISPEGILSTANFVGANDSVIKTRASLIKFVSAIENLPPSALAGQSATIATLTKAVGGTTAAVVAAAPALTTFANTARGK